MAASRTRAGKRSAKGSGWKRDAAAVTDDLRESGACFQVADPTGAMDSTNSRARLWFF